MKKVFLVLGLLAAGALAKPAPADAHFALSIGLPGFGVFIHEPCPPVVYGPPVYYRPPVYYYPYYAPAPVVFVHHHHHGNHFGWSRHRDWDDD